MKQFEQLVFQIQQWQKSTVHKITMDFKVQSVIYSIPAKNIEYSKLYPLKEMQKLRDRLHECLLENWEPEYTQPVIDGTVWQLELLNGLRSIKKCCGENRFPENWEAFCEIVQEYAPVPQEKILKKAS